MILTFKDQIAKVEPPIFFERNGPNDYLIIDKIPICNIMQFYVRGTSKKNHSIRKLAKKIIRTTQGPLVLKFWQSIRTTSTKKNYREIR